VVVSFDGLTHITVGGSIIRRPWKYRIDEWRAFGQAKLLVDVSFERLIKPARADSVSLNGSSGGCKCHIPSFFFPPRSQPYAFNLVNIVQSWFNSPVWPCEGIDDRLFRCRAYAQGYRYGILVRGLLAPETPGVRMHRLKRMCAL